MADVIVGGEYSHGKGTVQAVLNLNQAPLLNMFGHNNWCIESYNSKVLSS